MQDDAAYTSIELYKLPLIYYHEHNMKKFENSQAGIMNPLLIPTIVLGVLVLGFGSFAIWSFVNYSDQKNNVDQKITAAVATAKTQQTGVDQKNFLEREKEPYRQFIGPDDLGRVTFNYPKTWSVYVDKSSDSQYEAYLQPGVVPPTTSQIPYATRVTVATKSYESTLQLYQDLVKKGDLKSSPIAISGLNGTRLDGNFSKTVQGSMVVFKIRDKSLSVYTESDTFKPDFDGIILKSLDFNP